MRKLWREFRDIFNPGSVIRVSLAVAASFALLIAIFQWAVPQFQVPNLWPAIILLSSHLFMVFMLFVLLTLMRPLVTVCAESIVVQHGQRVNTIDSKTITAAYLTFHTQNRVRLRICYTLKDLSKTRVIGVPPTVDFFKLSEILPISPVIRDARNRSFMARR